MSRLRAGLARRDRRRRGRLNWAIAISAPPGPEGDVWGDVYFADDLATALRRRGQNVHVDRLGERNRISPGEPDDVVVTLFGLHEPYPAPGALNLLWIISHPEYIDDEKLGRGWDLCYAASTTWPHVPERRAWGIRPLLQATDPERFSPSRTGDEIPSDVLFVGKTRGVHRPIVRDAIAVGADLAVYGDGWQEYIDGRYVRAEFLENAMLPAAYRGARIVLNDHWADMAEAGFVSNRLFDAVAAGAIVVTDPVAGLPAEFGGSVRVSRDASELSSMLSPGAAGWPDADERLAAASATARSHSFDARAAVLLSDALEALTPKRRRRGGSDRESPGQTLA